MGSSRITCRIPQWSLFYVQIGGIFELFGNEIDLAKIAFSCLDSLEKLCDQQGVHDSARRSIGHHCLWCELFWVRALINEKEHWHGVAFGFRHTPRNGKPLFSMFLALPEIGYKEAQHGH